MADNLTTQSGTPATVPSATTIATDDIAGVHYQRVKLVDGTLDGTGAIGGDATNGLDVDVTRVQGTVTVADGGGTLSVDDGGGSITVDGTFWQATQPVSIAATVAVDTELPTAAALADATVNPTVPAVGSLPHVYNGTTWDRARGDSTNGLWVNVKSIPSVGVTGTFWQSVQPVSLAVGPAATTDLVYGAPAGSTTAGVDTAILSAVSAKYLYITGINIANTSTTTTLISFYRNTYATEVVYRTIAPALGGSNITFATPLRLSAVNQLFGYRHETTVSGGSVYVSAVGYAGA